MAEDDKAKFIYDGSGNPTTQQCLDSGFVAESTTCSSRLNTNEGITAWNEAVTFMSAAAALPALTWSNGLSQACFDHIKDQGPTGATGHTGSDSSTPGTRISRYTTWNSWGENIAYSNVENGYDVILQLIIDDGVSTRGHRDNIMNADFTHVGVSCGCHSTYTEMCCIAYGKNVAESNPSMTLDSAPQLSTCNSYTASTSGDTTGLFDISSNPPTVSNSLNAGSGSSGSGTTSGGTTSSSNNGSSGENTSKAYLTEIFKIGRAFV